MRLAKSEFSLPVIVVMLSVGLLFSFRSAFASIYNSSEQVLHFTQLDAERTLSNSVVNAIAQDELGFIWIATQDGLNRFDGKYAKYYNNEPGNPSSLAFNWVWDIHVDSKGQVWVVGDGGISRYEPQTDSFINYLPETSYPNLKGSKFRTIAEAPNGTLWFGTQTSGIAVYNPEADAFSHIDGGLDTNGSLNSNNIRDILIDDAGNVWVATYGGGLNVLPADAQDFQQFTTESAVSTPSDNIRSLYSANDGTLWVGTKDSGVFTFDRENGVKRHAFYEEGKPGGFCDNWVRDIYQDSKQRMWFATTGGLCQWDAGQDKFIAHRHDNTRTDSLLDNRVLALFQDDGGVMWVGTYQGISRWNAEIEPFDLINRSFGVGKDMDSEVITSFATSTDGTLFVGTWGGGLNVFDTQAGTLQVVRADPGTPGKLQGDRVMSLLVDSDNNLWVGTQRNGLHLRKAGDSEFINFRHDPQDPSSLSANAVSKIVQLADGTVVVGTYGGGINLVRGSYSFDAFRYSEDDTHSLSSDRVIDIMQDSNGDIWVATNGGGINRFITADKVFEHFRFDPENPDSIESDDIYSMLETEEHYWFATHNAGVARLSKDSLAAGEPVFEHFSRPNILPSSVVYGMLADHLGYIWLSHSKGLSRLTPATMEVMNFNTTHGLQGSDFNNGAYHKADDGRIFFGGPNGFNTFMPGNVPINTNKAPIRLTKYTRLNEEVLLADDMSEEGELELSYHDAFIGFEFAALDFTKPEDNSYQYKLEGFTDDWIDAGQDNTITFSNLLDGSYTLRVRGTNNNGIWSDDELTIPIVVSPPVWRSWQAFLAYFLILAAIALLLWRNHREKRDRQKKYQQQLEKDVQQRTEQLRAANEQLGKAFEETSQAREAAEKAASAKEDFLAIMSHEIRTPLNSILGMSELLLNSPLSAVQQRYAGSAHRAGSMLLELINDILDFSKMEAGKVELEQTEFDYHGLIEETCFLFANRAQEKGVELTIVIDKNCPRFIMGDALRLRQVLSNLLSNAIKFTESGSVDITTYSDGKSVYMRVADTGIGMNEEQRAKIFEAFQQADTSTTRKFGGTGLGLSITKQIVELMRGHIGVDSVPGKGTVFAIAFPVKAADAQVDDCDLALVRQVRVNVIVRQPAVRRMATNTIERLDVRFKDLSDDYEAGFNLPADDHDIYLVDAALAKTDHWQQAWSQLRLKVIVLTSAYEEFEQPKALPNLQLLSKPVRRTALFEALQALMDGETSVRQIDKPQAFQETSRFKAKVLLAEDAQTNIEVATAMLTMFGCEVDTALDGSIAVDKIKQSHYDLVFMDCQMPVMDGFEATRQIRRHEQETSSSPATIVALTAGVGLGYEETAVAAGMNDYMNKPFTSQQLFKMLNRHLGQCRYDVEPGEPVIVDQQTHTVTENVVESAPSANEALIDHSAIEAIREIEKSTGRELFSRVLATFEQEMNQKQPELNTLVEEGDAQGINRVAHAMKSLCANAGAKLLRELCGIMEAAAKEQNLDTCKQSLAEFNANYLPTLQSLKSIVSNSNE
ncbi:ATP-binding protein [Alteromonas sp. ASW11-19]|uniref:histidine kinase n=1 Tax=Alteromonas salexigens TaxID=2982530 RepID=A0ABT2VPW9_9ALTE|nr:two-component regulator propeller domain-containing protein [Alteromonas salexigens]MCU7555367.1 ATP-binding protein [Alteromonas salexigens]